MYMSFNTNYINLNYLNIYVNHHKIYKVSKYK